MGRAWVGRRRERGSAAFYREQEGEERSPALHGPSMAFFTWRGERTKSSSITRDSKRSCGDSIRLRFRVRAGYTASGQGPAAWHARGRRGVGCCASHGGSARQGARKARRTRAARAGRRVDDDPNYFVYFIKYFLIQFMNCIFSLL
jgi:hypothetical protein